MFHTHTKCQCHFRRNIFDLNPLCDQTGCIVVKFSLHLWITLICQESPTQEYKIAWLLQHKVMGKGHHQMRGPHLHQSPDCGKFTCCTLKLLIFPAYPSCCNTSQKGGCNQKLELFSAMLVIGLWFNQPFPQILSNISLATSSQQHNASSKKGPRPKELYIKKRTKRRTYHCVVSPLKVRANKQKYWIWQWARCNRQIAKSTTC